MTPAQRDLILAALGLRERNGRMPRWSSGNRFITLDGRHRAWPAMLDAGWATHFKSDYRSGHLWRVTRAGADAAGVLGRCKREHVGR